MGLQTFRGLSRSTPWGHLRRPILVSKDSAHQEDFSKSSHQVQSNEFLRIRQEIKEAEELQKARESTEEQFKDILDNSRNVGQQIDWL